MKLYAFGIITLFLALYGGVFSVLWLVLNMQWWGALIVATLFMCLILLTTLREVKAPYLQMKEHNDWKEDHEPRA